MVPNWIKWCQMVPYGPIWSKMVSNGFKWLQMVPNGSKCFQMVSNGFKLFQSILKGFKGFKRSKQFQLVPNEHHDMHLHPCSKVYLVWVLIDKFWFDGKVVKKRFTIHPILLQLLFWNLIYLPLLIKQCVCQGSFNILSHWKWSRSVLRQGLNSNTRFEHNIKIHIQLEQTGQPLNTSTKQHLVINIFVNGALNQPFPLHVTALIIVYNIEFPSYQYLLPPQLFPPLFHL